MGVHFVSSALILKAEFHALMPILKLATPSAMQQSRVVYYA